MFYSSPNYDCVLFKWDIYVEGKLYLLCMVLIFFVSNEKLGPLQNYGTSIGRV